MKPAAPRAALPKTGAGRTDVRFRHQFRKTELCVFYQKGCCAKGSQCTYAHGLEEIQETPDLTKTSLCPKWRKWSCRRSSEDCPFAHGAHELRVTEAYALKPKSSKSSDSTPEEASITCGTPDFTESLSGTEAAASPHGHDAALETLVQCTAKRLLELRSRAVEPELQGVRFPGADDSYCNYYEDNLYYGGLEEVTNRQVLAKSPVRVEDTYIAGHGLKYMEEPPDCPAKVQLSGCGLPEPLRVPVPEWTRRLPTSAPILLE